jgi:hypothetical protein
MGVLEEDDESHEGVGKGEKKREGKRATMGESRREG